MFVVTRMLEMAGVTSYDVVYDLGAGDGRIVITAADRYGAKGVGVENDPEIAAVARDRVKKFNVADRVTILEADVMKVDISAATVVTMYLAPRAYRMLKPRLQNQLAPGTRVVTHGTPIPGWTPIDAVSVAQEGVPRRPRRMVYLYRTPGGDTLSGTWTWTPADRPDMGPVRLRLREDVDGITGDFVDPQMGAAVPVLRASREGNSFVVALEFRKDGRIVRRKFRGILRYDQISGDVLTSDARGIATHSWRARREPVLLDGEWMWNLVNGSGTVSRAVLSVRRTLDGIEGRYENPQDTAAIENARTRGSRFEFETTLRSTSPPETRRYVGWVEDDEIVGFITLAHGNERWEWRAIRVQGAPRRKRPEVDV